MGDKSKNLRLSGDELVQRVTDETYNYILQNDPDLYNQLTSDPSKKNQSNILIADVVNQDSKDNQGLADNQTDLQNEYAIQQQLQTTMPYGRTMMVSKGLLIPSYDMDIVQRVYDGKYLSLVMRDLKYFNLPTLLDSDESSWVTKLKQWASIILEAIMLVMSVVGIAAAPTTEAVATVTEDIEVALQSSSDVQKALTQLQAVFMDAVATNSQKARAIFDLLMATKAAGILWTVIKTLCSQMSWWQWIKTAALVTAQIFAAFFTDGLALIAKIILALNAAYNFIKKILNLNTLDNNAGLKKFIADSKARKAAAKAEFQIKAK